MEPTNQCLIQFCNTLKNDIWCPTFMNNPFQKSGLKKFEKNPFLSRFIFLVGALWNKNFIVTFSRFFFNLDEMTLLCTMPKSKNLETNILQTGRLIRSVYLFVFWHTHSDWKEFQCHFRNCATFFPECNFPKKVLCFKAVLTLGSRCMCDTYWCSKACCSLTNSSLACWNTFSCSCNFSSVWASFLFCSCSFCSVAGMANM